MAGVEPPGRSAARLDSKAEGVGAASGKSLRGYRLCLCWVEETAGPDAGVTGRLAHGHGAVAGFGQ